MAVIGRVRTTTDTVRFLQIQYPWLAANETLDTVDVLVEPQGGGYNPLTPFIIDLVVIETNHKSIRFRASGGEKGGLYKVEFTVTTSLTQQNEDCLEFTVDEACI